MVKTHCASVCGQSSNEGKFPGKSSSLPSSVRRRGETKIVTRRKPESSWTPLGSSVSVPDSVGIGSIPR
jgi:hypothetical protein